MSYTFMHAGSAFIVALTPYFMNVKNSRKSYVKMSDGLENIVAIRLLQKVNKNVRGGRLISYPIPRRLSGVHLNGLIWPYAPDCELR